MEISEYFLQKKKLYHLLLNFIEKPEEHDINFQDLIQFIQNNDIQRNQEELNHFLQLLLNIANNHHRKPGFFNKIEQIIQYFENDIKKTFSNLDIFNIFKSNKKLLLFLFDKNIITLDSSLFDQPEIEYDQYCGYFSPEIKKLPDEERKKFNIDISQFDNDTNFEEKRQIGENDSYICSLIRQDSIEEFIAYINQINYSLSSTINPSIFETNSFLIDKTPTLIEYAAFFGSIKIFKYLAINNIELEPSSWLYSIHSNDPEMINFLEENSIQPNDTTYEECFKESVKCHHNDIACFIQNNYFQSKDQITNENIIECCFHYFNYNFFPDDLTSSIVFFYLCKYGYSKMVEKFLNLKKNEIEKEIIFIF